MCYAGLCPLSVVFFSRGHGASEGGCLHHVDWILQADKDEKEWPPAKKAKCAHEAAEEVGTEPEEEEGAGPEGAEGEEAGPEGAEDEAGPDVDGAGGEAPAAKGKAKAKAKSEGVATAKGAAVAKSKAKAGVKNPKQIKLDEKGEPLLHRMHIFS